MTKTQSTVLLVLLAALLVVAVHRAYFKKNPPLRWDYKAAEGDKIDVAQLQSVGGDGWDCSVIPKTDTSTSKYIVLCKRPIP